MGAFYMIPTRVLPAPPDLLITSETDHKEAIMKPKGAVTSCRCRHHFTFLNRSASRVPRLPAQGVRRSSPRVHRSSLFARRWQASVRRLG
jgi:hypothetical protein